MVRGLSFTPEDDAALAPAWKSVSSGHDEQNATFFWESVSDAFQKQETVSYPELTVESLSSRWGTL